MILILNSLKLVTAVSLSSVSNSYKILKNQDVSSCGTDMIFKKIKNKLLDIFWTHFVLLTSF